MAGKEKFHGLSNALSNAQKRLDQLRSWESSETNKQPNTVKASRRVPTIKFGDSVVFLAAAHSGDTEEVDRLVRKEGANVNSVNKDGLTALHQCCIDDDFDMVKALVKLKANLDIQDKEGWTPLHAAASCGHAHIVRYLLDHGSFPALVNNEGDTPMDLAEDSDDIAEMIQESIDQNTIDVDAIRGVEESMMLEDANRLKNDPALMPVVGHDRATPLHVAAAKNYLQVMKILLGLKASQVQIDAEDEDGWTPLHAAVYWGHFEAAELLVCHGADLNKKTTVGDSVEDLCEPELEDELNTLKKYGEQNNRQRSNAISTSTSSTSSSSSQTKQQQRLIHSNSREDLKHPSPQIVRRRSSKERSLFPKIDIAKEREERENFTGGDSPPLSSSTTNTTTTFSSSSSSAGGDKNHSPPTGRPWSNQNTSSKPSNAVQDMAQEKTNSNKNSPALESSSSSSCSSSSSPPSSLKQLSTTTTTTTTTAAATTATPNSTPSSSDPNSAAESPMGSPTQKTKNSSPKGGRKKFIGMSPKMMLRVGQWESAVTSPVRTVSSGGRGLVPVASSTPSSSDDGNNPSPAPSTETKRYSFQPKTISPSSSSSSLPPRSMSMESRPLSGRTGMSKKLTHDELDVSSLSTKRSSYAEESTNNNQRRVSPSSSSFTSTAPKGDYKASSLPWGSTTNPKRNSTGEKVSLLAPPEGGYRASSLPRSTKIATLERKEEEARKKDLVSRDEVAGKGGVSTEAMATPSSQTAEGGGGGEGVSSTSSRDTSLLAPRDTSREMSVESNNSSTRGNTEDSETNRKIRAKKQRSTRKSTQPVPVDFLEQLNKYDRQMEVAEEEAQAHAETKLKQQQHQQQQSSSSRGGGSNGGGNSGSGGPVEQTDSPAPANKWRKSSSDGTAAKKRDGGGTGRQGATITATSSVAVAAAGAGSTSPRPLDEVKGLESASSAEQQKTRQQQQQQQQQVVVEARGGSSEASGASVETTPQQQQQKGSSHRRSKSSPSSYVENKDDSSSSAAMHPRTKSTTRRRPREKRRSTGIVTEITEGEEVPDGLQNLVRTSGGGGGGDTDDTDLHSPQSLLSADDSAIMENSLQGAEASLLQAQLEEAQGKSQRLEREVEGLVRELDQYKAKNVELNRRFQDATRAYEQERRENEMKDAKLQEMQNHPKLLQELKHENQRMKDENSALIRVIGKLSRSPLPHQSHT